MKTGTAAPRTAQNTEATRPADALARTAVSVPGRANADGPALAVLPVASGLLLTTLAATTAVLFRRDRANARTRLDALPTSIYRSAYGNIQYRVSGDGPVVLVSHGITGGVDQAENLVTRCRNFRSGYRFIYVSRFGYLRSALPRQATVRMQAAVYRELLDYLGIERVFVVGNSAGGPSAMWFAIDYAERTNGLILISSAVPGPVPAPIPPLVARHDFIYWAAVKSVPDVLLGLLMPKSVIAAMTTQDKAFAVETAFMASMPISERTVGNRFDNTVTVPGVNDVPFEQITPPTLIFQAVDDPREYAGGQQMARRIPDSTFVGLTGGHLLTGHATEIQTANAEFIAKHGDR